MLVRCMTLIGATDELLIYVFGVPLDNIRKIDLACGGPVLGFGRIGGLLRAFGFLDFCLASGILLVGHQDILLLVGFWRAFNWLLLGLWWGPGNVYISRSLLLFWLPWWVSAMLMVAHVSFHLAFHWLLLV